MAKNNTKKPVAKKPVAKKPVAKKAPVKQAVKKAPAKKPAPKKAVAKKAPAKPVAKKAVAKKAPAKKQPKKACACKNGGKKECTCGGKCDCYEKLIAEVFGKLSDTANVVVLLKDYFYTELLNKGIAEAKASDMANGIDIEIASFEANIDIIE